MAFMQLNNVKNVTLTIRMTAESKERLGYLVAIWRKDTYSSYVNDLISAELEINKDLIDKFEKLIKGEQRDSDR